MYVSKTMSKWKGNIRCRLLNCKVYISQNRICQFEYKSTPTIAVYVYFHFFMLFCFCSLFLRFVSLALSVLFVVIVFVRSHFYNLISRLRLAIIVHSYVQHNIYAILHVQCTLYDPSSAIDWQNDQFLMCTSLSAINAIVVAVVIFSVRHSFVRTIIWLNRIEQTENLLKEFMTLRLITDWALFWVNDFYSHVIHILW